MVPQQQGPRRPLLAVQTIAAATLGPRHCQAFVGSLQGRFVPVDGGVHRVCRGNTSDDDALQYYEAISEVDTLAMCGSLCIDRGTCTGIEYSDTYKVCELWTKEEGPQTTMEAEGYTCLALVRQEIEEVDGGYDRGCRGPGRVQVHEHLQSLAACTSLCAASPACRGVEYATAALGDDLDGHCKLFEGDEGITRTISARGYMCLRLERPESRRLLLV